MRRVSLPLVFLALLSLFGSAVYYTTMVTTGTLAIAMLFAVLGTWGMDRLVRIEKGETVPRVISTKRVACIFLVGIASLAAFTLLAATHPITTATRSLWLLFSPAHILLLAVAFLCVLLLAQTPSRLSALLGSLVTFCTSALAAIVFPLGFGFDPFLHRATLEHIISFGTIAPKPFYYIGTYSLELAGAILLHLPLFTLDVFLAPLGLAYLVYIALRTKTFHPAFLALIPFAAFISTTPQAIGFLWILALIIAAKNNLPAPYLWLFALAALAAHPLAGVPAVLLALLISIQHVRFSRAASIVVCILGVFAIPLMFFTQQLLTGMNVGFSLASFTDFSRIPALGLFSFHGNAPMDTVMLFGGNLFFIVILFAIVGYIGRGRERAERECTEQECTERFKTVPVILAAIIALGNFVMLSLGFDFPFLISYERTDFALRLVTIAWIFLLPVASDGIQTIIKYSSRMYGTVSNRSLQTYTTCILVLLFSANAYVAYPRHDGYTRSAAFNVTAADIEIVHRIAERAGNESYVVLGNQTLSSAAIQEFGFFQYYHGDIFAYPIPTSGTLYKLFLRMIEEAPSLETVQAAKDLTGATEVYFVVHDYWFEAPERIDDTKKITDDWFTSENGTVTVFVFTL